MRIEQLRALIEVNKAGSINAAAERLYMTQQNLNRMIKKLEEELGYQLIVCTNHGVSITDAGNIVLNYAQNIIHSVDDMQRILRNGKSSDDSEAKLAGSINIELSPTLNIAILPQAYQEFTSKYPEVQVYAVENYRNTIIENVKEHSDTLGLICISNQINSFLENLSDDLEFIPIKTYPMYIMMSPTHPLAGSKKISIKSLAPYPLVVYEAGGVDGIRALPNKVILSSNNYFLCKEKLSEKDSNAIMYSFPFYKKRHLFDNLVHIPISDHNWTSIIYLITNKNMSSEQRRLVNVFMKVFSDYLPSQFSSENPVVSF